MSVSNEKVKESTLDSGDAVCCVVLCMYVSFWSESKA